MEKSARRSSADKRKSTSGACTEIDLVPPATAVASIDCGPDFPFNFFDMKRTASAIWNGDLKQGKGALSTQGGVLEQTPYSFSTRFEHGEGTNPEELIAAAHAGCFTMQLSAFLAQAGFTADELKTDATLTFEQVDGAWTITGIQLDLKGRVPGVDAAKFAEFAQDAKAKCPVSRALNAKITLTANLENPEG